MNFTMMTMVTQTSRARRLIKMLERLIKNEFSITVNAYLSPEFTQTILGKIAETKSVPSIGKVSFSEGNVFHTSSSINVGAG